MFLSSSTINSVNDSVEKLLEKRVASKRELLDFRSAKNADNKGDNNSATPKIININTASIIELTTLPGIGEKTAQNILNYREKFGKFKKADELMYIKGIGKSKFQKIKNLITVN